MIKEFRGKYRFLSNFYPSPIDVFHNFLNFWSRFPTVEHAYQAEKTLSDVHRVQIQECKTPGEAKKLGRIVPLKPNWEQIKLSVMRELVLNKFSTHEELKNKLLETGDQNLIEGNTWGDKYWGMCLNTFEGENHLGRILMDIRKFLRRQNGSYH